LKISHLFVIRITLNEKLIPVSTKNDVIPAFNHHNKPHIKQKMLIMLLINP